MIVCINFTQYVFKYLSIAIIFLNLIHSSIAVPPPTVSIMYTQPGVFYYGSQTSISCVLTITPSVNVPVMMNALWIGPQGQITNDTRSVVITITQGSTNYKTTLQISSLRTNDSGLYQCVGSISSNSSYVVGTSNASANISLSVQGENTYETRPLMLTPSLSSPGLPPPVVTTSSYGSMIAGSVHSLMCMVKVVDGLVVVPVVVWMKDGGILVNGSNIILTRTVSGGISTLNLTFNPLLTSHGGQYTCAANISDQNVTNSLRVNVSVQSVFNIQYTVLHVIVTNQAIDVNPFPLISRSPSSCGHHIIIWQHNSWICVLAGVYGEGGRWTGSCPCCGVEEGWRSSSCEWDQYHTDKDCVRWKQYSESHLQSSSHISWRTVHL